MKAGKILLAAAFALTLAASANAGIHVWWESADAGAQGQTLNLECAPGARCDWDLTMYIGLDSEADTLVGWAEDLLNTGYESIVTVKSSSLPVAGAWPSAGHAGNAGATDPNFPYGYNMLVGAYGLNLSGSGTPGPGAFAALYITLSVNGATAGDVINIMSEGGAKAWAGSATEADFFGATGPLNYYYGGIPYGGEVRGAPAITINVVPEPTTVAFLGLGALALIRRRR